MGQLANRVFSLPSVQLLSPLIPIRDVEVHVANEDRVVCQIEQAGLLCALHHLALQVVACSAEVFLNAAAHGTEPCSQQGETDEHDEIGNVRAVDLKRITRLSEEEIEERDRQYQGNNGRTRARIPRRDRHGKQEQGQLDSMEIEALHQ